MGWTPHGACRCNAGEMSSLPISDYEGQMSRMHEADVFSLRQKLETVPLGDW